MYSIENKEEIDMTKLQEQLEQQYGPAVAQDIMDRMRKNGATAKTPDYMDVKAMSELQERFRAQAMMAVCRLKHWRKQEAAKGARHNLVVLEGAFLERQCVDAVKLYRLATTTYFAMYREALAAITSSRSTDNYIASKMWA